MEILRLVEHKTLWFQGRVSRAELIGDPFDDGPKLPQEPDVGEQAIIETLLVAFGSSALRYACSGWTTAAGEMDKQLAIAAWNWEQNYHGPETPTSAGDIAELQSRLQALATEKETVETAVAQEVRLVREGSS